MEKIRKQPYAWLLHKDHVRMTVLEGADKQCYVAQSDARSKNAHLGRKWQIVYFVI